MAARRPKDVSAWLGGNRGTVQSSSSTEQQIDTGGGEKDAVNSTLALGLAGAAGLTAAGVALRKTGVVPATMRYVTNRDATYFVHGSPTKNIKKLDPKYELMPDKIASEPYFLERFPEGVNSQSIPAVYGNPLKTSGGGRKYANKLVSAQELRESIYDSKGYAGNVGSLYIAKVPKNKFYDQYTESTAKVVREIDVTNLSNKEALTKTLKTLKQLGFKTPKKR